jgi:glutamine synthetase
MSQSGSLPSTTAVTGMLTLDELRERVKKDEINQVIMSFPDMYGRLMGKRFDADFFLESAVEDGTHCCTYLLICDMEMQIHPGYMYSNWQRGFGDFHLVPDMPSLRLVSWKDKSATVMCDIYDDHSLVSFAPRSILRRQIDAASNLSYKVMSASELEYYTFENSYRDAHALNYQQSKLKPVGDYSADYHLLQTAREEKYTGLFRKHLKASGIPVENSKGEYGLGQHELNIKFTDILSMADRHVTYKQCLKEIADDLGISVTFMAKPFADQLGSGCHLHLSVTNPVDGTNSFTGDEDFSGSNIKCSPLFKHFLAGWMKYTPDMMVFYAPTINSYKRFIDASFAPTRIAWSYDNRTAGFRVVGRDQSLRIECRIAGADCNIYLAFAAALASGLQGVKDKLPLPPMFTGNAYDAKDLLEVPKTLKEATHVFQNSPFARQAFGDDVVDHYSTFYCNEQAAYDKAVTDWERHRYFERI